MADAGSLKDDETFALIKAMQNPLRARVLTAVIQRPGVTVKQLAERLGEPTRRVRHQLKKLVEAELVEVSASSSRRNARERHYEAVGRPWLDSWERFPTTIEERRRAAMSAVSLFVDDLRQATEVGTFGTEEGHHEVRVPGEVDRIAWQELGRLLRRTVEEIEETMRRSARRLEAEGEQGTEAVCSLFFFETRAWPAGEEADAGRTRKVWLQEAPGDDHGGSGP